MSDRVDCPVAAACGGCALIGLAADEQLRRKTERVREALAAFPRLDGVALDPCRPAPAPTGYRERAKLAVRAVDGAVVAGLHARGSDRPVDIAPCRVQRPTLLARLEPVRAWLGRHRLARPAGPVTHVDLREAAGGAWHLTLVVRAEAPPDDLPLDELRAAAAGLVGVSVNANPHESSYVFGPTTRTPLGARGFPVDVDGPDGRRRRFEVPATGFFQITTAPLAAIHRSMLEHLGDRGALVDLYCGVGLHGLTLAAIAPGGGPLVGVEEHAAAAACARRNADRLGVPARILSGRVERRLAELPAARRVVLNPGRAGCRPAVLEALAPDPGRRLVYLSCEPSTLARDLDALVGAGWRVERVTPIDLMPQTDQVETLARLSAPGDDGGRAS